MSETVFVIICVGLTIIECILIPVMHWIGYKRDCKKYGKDKVDKYYKKWEDKR